MREFLTLDIVRPGRIRAIGTGTLQVITAPVYRRGARYRIALDGKPLQVLRAGRSRRLRLTVALGPVHRSEQFSQGRGDLAATRSRLLRPARGARSPACAARAGEGRGRHRLRRARAARLRRPAAGAKAPPRPRRTRRASRSAPDHGSGVFGQLGARRARAPVLPLHARPAAPRPRPCRPRSPAAATRGTSSATTRSSRRPTTAATSQLWSQRRTYQWINTSTRRRRHFAGGYGYLRVGGRTISTLYDDLPASAGATRRFGTGYVERYLPGSPVRRQGARLRAVGRRPRAAPRRDAAQHDEPAPPGDLVRVLGREPAEPGRRHPHPARPLAPGLGRRRRRPLRVGQSDLKDSRPLDIYAAALDAPVAGFETSAAKFFGSGTRAEPEAVKADRATNSLAAPTAYLQNGETLFAFRSPVTIPAGKTVTLRYAYGAAPRAEIPDVVKRHRARPREFRATSGEWKRWLPQARFGRGRSWLSRELQWDAYTLRSATTYEDGCGGAHIISQGGFYQYSFGFQGAYPRPAPARAADDLHGARDRARRDPLLRGAAGPLEPRHHPVRDASASASASTSAPRTTSTCGCC